MDKTYYQITVFKDANKWGCTMKNKYKRFENGHKKFNRLITSGKYETVILRREQEWENGSSKSTPIAIYIGGGK